MQDEDLPESGNIEDRRGEGGYVGGGLGGGGFGMPGGAGGLSIGAIVVIGLIGYALGIDPRTLLDTAEVATRNQPRMDAPSGQQRQSGTPQDESGRFVARILGSTEAVWKDVFSKSGRTYRAPVLVLFSGSTNAPCGGVARSSTGPFYCPSDRKIYLDTSFFREIETRFRGCEGRSCRFSQAYVIAHEVGHHVQNELGILGRAHSAQQAAGGRSAEANRIQVRVELQADCFAGVWAKHENDDLVRQGKRPMIEAGDVEAALRTAAAIGDDTLQRNAGRVVMPDSFTHGSSEQRQRWFNNGIKGGTVESCNTFSSTGL
jgi:predicted metalloprotease